MNITILNGELENTPNGFSEFLESLTKKFNEHHTAVQFNLHEMNLHYCMGCWSCWWKTPGKCAIKDDGEEIFKTVIHSDFVIFASPVIAGFTSSLLKKITDRLIVLLHPYIKLKNGECHHQKRYDSYPDIGLILKKEVDTDDEDLSIIRDIYDRFAINFHCRKKYLKTTDQTNIEEIIYETCNI